MNSHEETIRNLYRGILCNYPRFIRGADAHLEYDFSCAEFERLRSEYALADIAKTGTAFERAKRLTHYLAPRLTHSPFYDNHVECNALELLSYSLNNSGHGINCLNKAKILAECCLAVGIYARRVFIMPFSPFDFDSHVVCEIYDEKHGKWIMLDPTTDGYFVNEDRVPLSMAEIRESFIEARFLTYTPSVSRNNDLHRTAARNEGINTYMMKNSFRISFEEYNGFGEKKTADGKRAAVDLVPENYSVCRNEELNARYRIANMLPEYKHLLGAQDEYLKKVCHETEPAAYSAESVYAPPNEK